MWSGSAQDEVRRDQQHSAFFATVTHVLCTVDKAAEDGGGRSAEQVERRLPPTFVRGLLHGGGRGTPLHGPRGAEHAAAPRAPETSQGAHRAAHRASRQGRCADLAADAVPPLRIFLARATLAAPEALAGKLIGEPGVAKVHVDVPEVQEVD